MSRMCKPSVLCILLHSTFSIYFWYSDIFGINRTRGSTYINGFHVIFERKKGLWTRLVSDFLNLEVWLQAVCLPKVLHKKKYLCSHPSFIYKWCISANKNYYVVRNAGWTRSRNTWKLTLNFCLSINQWVTSFSSH